MEKGGSLAPELLRQLRDWKNLSIAQQEFIFDLTDNFTDKERVYAEDFYKVALDDECEFEARVVSYQVLSHLVPKGDALRVHARETLMPLAHPVERGIDWISYHLFP